MEYMPLATGGGRVDMAVGKPRGERDCYYVPVLRMAPALAWNVAILPGYLTADHDPILIARFR